MKRHDRTRLALGLLAALGLIIAYGAVGALERGRIGEWQFICRSVAGLGLLLPCVRAVGRLYTERGDSGNAEGQQVPND